MPVRPAVLSTLCDRAPSPAYAAAQAQPSCDCSGPPTGCQKVHLHPRSGQRWESVEAWLESACTGVASTQACRGLSQGEQARPATHIEDADGLLILLELLVQGHLQQPRGARKQVRHRRGGVRGVDIDLRALEHLRGQRRGSGCLISLLVASSRWFFKTCRGMHSRGYKPYCLAALRG